MPNLTAKQEAFCQALVFSLDEHGKPITQSEAYRRSYNAKNMSEECIAVEACKLANNPDLTARIYELNHNKAINSNKDLNSIKQRIIDKFIRLGGKAEEKGQLSAAINAAIAEAKMEGVWIEQSKVEAKLSNDKAPEAVQERVEELSNAAEP
jgi:hypothetical protein